MLQAKAERGGVGAGGRQAGWKVCYNKMQLSRARDKPSPAEASRAEAEASDGLHCDIKFQVHVLSCRRRCLVPLFVAWPGCHWNVVLVSCAAAAAAAATAASATSAAAASLNMLLNITTFIWMHLPLERLACTPPPLYLPTSICLCQHNLPLSLLLFIFVIVCFLA